ncbi:type II and III secretion system protein family protein [Parvibaculum sp.]|uniref:type II and III secretion system protein family protein n=1 Tax=Parvibaculum sp. TaxID=2024848 RepID=UPI001B0E3F69|nr:type II and III secretion system protein family protein [Parvibaculum sp.]MBO6668225.1 type II and III secretion system protein family protein [Parvibaculum sp.]MBO6690969.1 type II and III secretion system protein family protein [Parvibaculum sp.]MBO6714657.1 type II and III secretion system protein family protein [Parvibaculum sp.]
MKQRRRNFDKVHSYLFWVWMIAAFAVTLMATSQSAIAAMRTLDIAVGGQRILKLERTIDRIAIADPGTVDVKVVSSRELRVLGQKEGTTDLTIWFADTETSLSYHIVVGADLKGLQAEFARDPALSGVKAVETGKGVVLKGQVYSLEDQQRARALAHSYLGEDVGSMIAVADRRMVAVEVRFAAVSTSTLKALGLNFQSLDNNIQLAAIGPNSSTSYGYDPVTGLEPNTSLPLSQAFNLFMAWPGSDIIGVISALSSANLAQLLAEPTLLVRSGEDAEFLAGGEIPVPVPQSGAGNGTVTIEYKKFGVQLDVAATVLDNDRIVLKVSPEVSELDYTNALVVQGFRVPALRSRSTRTTIELGDGQSFVLAGLMYSTSGNVEDRVPGIGELPVIGSFFKRTQNSRERQELIIIATPRLVSPMEAGEVPTLPGEGQLYDPSMGDILLNIDSLDDHVVKHGLMR